MSATTSPLPYWLIREAGKDHGFATVPLEAALSPETALESFREAEAGSIRSLGLEGTSVEVLLCVLRYDDAGDPSVTDLTSPVAFTL